MHLVVARHTEDLKWLRRVPRDIRVFVYDKGGSHSAPDLERGAWNVERKPLPNAGREAQAYLHHILRHYDDPASVTVFVQGKPFDHAPALHDFLRGVADGSEAIGDFRWLGFLIDRDDRRGSLRFQSWSKNPERRPLDMDNFWSAVFGAEPCPEEFVFFGGAQFAVSRERIRARPREFYERALAVASEFPDAAHCFERTWDRVFGVNGIPEELRGQPLPVYLKPIRRLMGERPG